MFRLAVPKGVHDNRVISFLKNEKEMIETEHFKRESDDEGLVHYIFPGMEEDNFKYIVSQLKNQGVTMIGVDTQLTEKNIMKLTNLIEDFSKNLNENESDDIINALKRVLEQWEVKQYPDDKARWEEYYMDIQELVQDFENINTSSDESDPYSHSQQQSPGIRTQVNINEQKLRKLIRKTIRQ